MRDDRSARVRRQALKWHAGRIHPERAVTCPHAVGARASECPSGVERLLERMSDENLNVRLAALMALGGYLPGGDRRVVRAVQKALDDPKRKVRHAAARILKVPCPGCGKTWQAAPDPEAFA